MIQTICVYSNKNKEQFALAISLLNRLQDLFLYPDIEELAVKQLLKQPEITVDFDSLLTEFKKYVADKKQSFSLFLIEFGLSDKRVLINGREGLICLEGILDRINPFATAFYIFKSSIIMTLNSQCQDRACLLSTNTNDLSADICANCLQLLQPYEKDFLNKTANWFSKLFSKIKNKELNDRELSRIFEVPRQLLYDFSFDCQEALCFIRNDFGAEDVKIAIVQIKVPFDDELNKEFCDGGLYKIWSDNGANQTNKIYNILKVLRDGESPDIVIFPELSVPHNFISHELLSELFGTSKKAPIIIAGSQYIWDNTNDINYEGAPIIFPCGGTIISYSRYPSKHEAHSDPRYTYVARNPVWVIEGQYNNVCVLICKDLFHTGDIFPSGSLNRIALLICVMCDSNVDEHYKEAERLSRERFIVIANSVGKYSAGNSAIMGPVKRDHLVNPWKTDSHKRIYGLLEEDKAKEVILVANINLRYPYGEKTPTDIPRAHYNNFYDPKTIYLNDDGSKRNNT